jgi:hypothetical protein
MQRACGEGAREQRPDKARAAHVNEISYLGRILAEDRPTILMYLSFNRSKALSCAAFPLEREKKLRGLCTAVR